jgi:hypothetical protein
MKTPPQWFFKLLIWLGLGMLGIGLLSFFFSSVILVSTARPRELAIIKDLEIAIKSFKEEYDRYPIWKGEPSQADLTLTTHDSPLIRSLLGQNLQDNPRAIRFIDLPIAAKGRGGLTGNQENYRLTDSFGNFYQITMDTNLDFQIRNPDPKNSDPKIRKDAAEWLPLSVIVCSSGKDGVWFSGDDNTSWRGGRSQPTPIYPTPNLLIWIGLIVLVVGVVGQFLSWYQATKNPYNL